MQANTTITAAWDVTLSDYEAGNPTDSIRILACGETIRDALEIAEAYIREYGKENQFFVESIQLIRLENEASPLLIGVSAAVPCLIKTA